MGEIAAVYLLLFVVAHNMWLLVSGKLKKASQKIIYSMSPESPRNWASHSPEPLDLDTLQVHSKHAWSIVSNQ